MKSMTFFSVAMTSILALAACGGDDDSSPASGPEPGNAMMDAGDTSSDPASGNIVEIAQAAGGFDSLLAAATKAGLADTLATGGPFTVFAPTDAAFAAALDALGVTLDDLDAETLADILSYHVVEGEVPAAAVGGINVATMLNGSDVRVSADAGNVTLTAGNGAVNVVTTDIMADNGIIHVVDKVMLPPADIATVAADAGFDSLVAAVVKAELADTLATGGPFTVFAPTDEAFAAALDSLGVTLDDLTKEDLMPILTYHVVSGKLYSEQVVAAEAATTLQGADVTISVGPDGVTLNEGVNVVATDVLAENGVIHIIDQVLLPPIG